MSFDPKTGRYFHKTEKVSPSDLLFFLEKHEGLENSVDFCAGKIKKVLSASVAAACHYVFSLIDDVAADAFFSALANGAELSAKSPVLTLRNRLLTIRNEGGGRAGSGYSKMLVSYLVSAFNAYRQGRPLSNISYSPEREIIVDGLKGAYKK
jgi:hypothetical protein